MQIFGLTKDNHQGKLHYGTVHTRAGYESPERGGHPCNSTLSLTSALDGGGWSTPRPGRFSPRKDPVPTVQEDGWAPRPVWMGAENTTPPPRRIRSTGYTYSSNVFVSFKIMNESETFLVILSEVENNDF